MKKLNNTIYITVPDIVISGNSRTAIDKYTSSGNKQLPFIKIRGEKLFKYDDLGAKYKADIVRHFGEPSEYLRLSPIKSAVRKDQDAMRYFLSLTKNGLHSFSNEWIEEKTIAAGWLNFLAKYFWDKHAIARDFNQPYDMFKESVCQLIKADGIDLPTHPKRLKKKVSDFMNNGYDVLVHAHTGKISNAAKVNDEKSEAFLLSLIENPNQHDNVTVCYLYNLWAKENGYKELRSPETVGIRSRNKGHEITMGRCGNSKMNEKYIRQVKGSKPSVPGYLWESDDNNLDFYFTDPDPKAANKNFNRYVSYIVADSYCGLILGKSYRQAKSPVVDMVRLAYIDAMYYVRSLTGGWHLPFEVKADHWQASTLFPYYRKIAKFVPPAHGNKHRGYIEQLFGSPHFKRCQKLGANNYNGNNVTAAKTGVNIEVLNLNEKNRPLIGGEAEKQIEQFFYRLRHMPDISKRDLNAPSKEQQWLAKWNTLTDSQKRPITDLEFLMLFGIKHEPDGRQITITNRGVEPQISGVKYSYDLPNYVDMMPFIGQKVNVFYDPYDMSRVLISNEKNILFIAQSAVLHPRALMDTCANSRQMLNIVLNQKKEQVKSVADKAASRREIVDNGYDPEAVLLAGFMPKELKNSVEQHYINQQSTSDFEAQRMAYMDAQIDFTKDFDN